PVEHQVVVLFALVNGYLDDVSEKKIGTWEEEFLVYMKGQGKDVLDDIVSEKIISDTTKELLEKHIKDFKEIYQD
ncbi:MAG: F0F1 ATP synthase subunit alpha, partial [Candidatus Moranbacteria bacterium]|nr:F0F1 ATP synthase subunit alpha [Candidatus Moranbacteria bacterium]